MRILFVVTRIAVAIAITAAVVAQLATSIGFWRGRGLADVTSNVVSFFSFFTIESNVAAAASPT